MPTALSEDQFVHRTSLSMSLLSRIDVNGEDFMQRIVTGNETWVYRFNSKSKIHPIVDFKEHSCTYHIQGRKETTTLIATVLGTLKEVMDDY